MLLRLVVVALMLVISACMTPQPAPSLDLKYVPSAQAALPNSMILALTQPRSISAPPLSNDLEKETSPVDTVPEIYAAKQIPRLQVSLEADLEKLFIAKGFLVSKSTSSVEGLVATDKQKISLMVVPLFDLAPLVNNDQTVFHYPGGVTRVRNIGTVQLTGSVTLEFLDPISKQKLLTKRIDVASFSANAPAEYEDQAEAETKFMLLLNKVYPRLMKKIEESIRPDELRTAITQSRRLQENPR
jgi:hypothetical protein